MLFIVVDEACTIPRVAASLITFCRFADVVRTLFCVAGVLCTFFAHRYLYVHYLALQVSYVRPLALQASYVPSLQLHHCVISFCCHCWRYPLNTGGLSGIERMFLGGLMKYFLFHFHQLLYLAAL